MKQLFTLLLSVVSFTALAQPGRGPEDKKQMERLKIAFLTEELDLSVEESQQFWPIYNAFEKERKAKEKAIRTTFRALEDEESPNEQTFKTSLEKVTQLRIDIANLEQAYFTDVTQVLGTEKTVKLVRAEHHFKQALMDKIRERQDGRGGPPGNGHRGRQQP